MTVVVLAGIALMALATVVAWMLCVSAARSDERMRRAFLDALRWPTHEDWALLDRTRRRLRQKDRAPS